MALMSAIRCTATTAHHLSFVAGQRRTPTCRPEKGEGYAPILRRQSGRSRAQLAGDRWCGGSVCPGDFCELLAAVGQPGTADGRVDSRSRLARLNKDDSGFGGSLQHHIVPPKAFDVDKDLFLGRMMKRHAAMHAMPEEQRAIAL